MTNIPGNPPPQPNPAQPYPPPPYQPGIYPPPKKGSSALKIVLIVVGVFVGIGIICVALLGYGVYKFAKSSNMTISTQAVTEADLGVAPYPGAEDKANVRMTVAGKDMLTATYLSSDSKDQVIAFYKDKLGPDAKDDTNSRGETLMLNKGSGESVLVTVTQSSSMQGGKTQIVIVHATPAAASAAAPATTPATTPSK